MCINVIQLSTYPIPITIVLISIAILMMVIAHLPNTPTDTLIHNPLHALNKSTDMTIILLIIPLIIVIITILVIIRMLA